MILSTTGWSDYQLLDSGETRKLERFGAYTLDRPDPQAIWKKSQDIKVWDKADAVFQKVTSDSGRWVTKTQMPDKWPMSIENISFWAQLTPFKHTGVFPEQINHWNWIKTQIESSQKPVRLLNLFGYTGIATLFAAAAGAEVVHVDSSRKSLSWAKENQLKSGLAEKKVHWILDDAVSFAKREIRRGNSYDVILLDPPVYGHGPKGERWDFDNDFPALVSLCGQLLSKDPLFVLVSAYATTNSSLTIGNVLTDATNSRGGTIETGELVIKQTDSSRLLPAGIYARWSQS